MDRSERLILRDGEDITKDVLSCNKSPKGYNIIFRNNKTTYSYGVDRIESIENPEAINPASVRVWHSGNEVLEIKEIYVFHAKSSEYWHIIRLNGNMRTYKSNEIQIIYSCLEEKESKNCISYLRQLAALIEIKNDDGEVKFRLDKHYKKINFVDTNNAMALYLNPKKHKARTYQATDIIFPFGGNASQFEAVYNALSNQISVVQGPPGTGKTQTILNILANLLIQGKTALVVSNNNSATLNIKEKLSDPTYCLDFIIAPLGKDKNKKKFIKNQTGEYPLITDWKRDNGSQIDLKEKISNISNELHNTFSAQNRLALVQEELESLHLEKKHFENYCDEVKQTPLKLSYLRRVRAKAFIKLWQECLQYLEKGHQLSLIFKLKSTFIYGIIDWSFYKNDLLSIVTCLQSNYYLLKLSELIDEISGLENLLSYMNAERKMIDLIDFSMTYLRAKLFDRYGDKQDRKSFTEDDLWMNPNDIIEEYPIVLSTTFSSVSSLRNITYDYLIMDESSQVDVATGALTLSCAKNAVIVGDSKQLPNIINTDLRKRCDIIYKSYTLQKGYSFSENSFLESICKIVNDVPQVLLREHYRCHPKIIGFCNQKFYNNELIIMTKDYGEPDALSLVRAPP